MSDYFDVFGMSTMEVCIRLMAVAISERISIHMTCRALVGDRVCTREDNCIACTSWDDITWNMFEVNVMGKERLRQRKRDKAAVAR